MHTPPRTRSLPRPTILCLTLAWALLPAGLAHAQLANWDRDRLVEGLRKRGMSDLLIHMAQTEKFEDPTDAQRIQVEQLRIRAADRSFTPEQQRQASEQAIAALRKLIADPALAEHPKRPMWQTDLAELTFLTHFRLHNEAADFYEFGVPTDAQRELFHKSAVEALVQLSIAERHLFKLRGELPRRADYQAKFVDTGLFERLMDEYDQNRTRYFGAFAAHYVATLPDGAPYYKELGKNPDLPRQGASPGEERKRLRALALDRLSGFIETSNTKVSDAVRRSARILQARLLGASGKAAQGIAILEELTRERTGDFEEFEALLALARLFSADGKPARAATTLTNLAGHEIARSSVLYQLLLTDARHRMLSDDAKADSAKIAQSYAPYEELLKEHPELTAFVNERWGHQVRKQPDRSKLPGMVLLGAADLSLSEGRNAVLEAQSIAETDAKKADALVAGALPKLKEAESIFQLLAGRSTDPATVRAKAMFNQGAAIYFQDTSDLATLLRANEVWRTLADRHPEQPEALTAATEAMGMLRALLAGNPQSQKDVLPAFEALFQVLQNRFPESPVTDDNRTFYVYELLIPRGRFQEAIDTLRKVPQGHPTYFDAQRGVLEGEMELYKAKRLESNQLPPQTELAKLARELRSAADSIIDANRTDPPASAIVASAAARLVAAQLAADRKDAAGAVRALDGFDELVRGDPDLLRQGLEFRIKSLATLGKAQEADTQATKMIESFPDAAYVVIDNVLRDLVREVDYLREEAKVLTLESDRKEMETRARDLALTGERLAKRLLAWAEQQKLADDELLVYRLILVKSMSLTGKASEAIAIIEPIAAKLPDDAAVIYNHAETLFYAAREDADPARKNQRQLAASAIYRRLIDELDPQQNVEARANRAMLEIWWQSWLRALQLSDERNRGADAIPDRIASLRQIDANLGGTILRVQFERLFRKHKK